MTETPSPEEKNETAATPEPEAPAAEPWADRANRAAAPGTVPFDSAAAGRRSTGPAASAPSGPAPRVLLDGTQAGP